MLKMRLGWYAGVSTALAGSVVISAFHQRANFYSAMVYLAQSNFCLLVLINFILLVYSSLIYALTQICFGTLRAIEVEQLTERAWFAITETCLAMTIFREEIGAWFLVMFTALVTGKVWGWIGDGRVEFLEQQPPPNPRLFHTRLSISLAMSLIYDVWLLYYTINTVIQEARPNMMVMFLFEFAVLATTSWRTAARYILSLTEQNIIKNQTKKRLLERREEVRQQREEMIRRREQAAAAGEEAPENQEPLPDPDDVDEMDIEVPGWVTKGEWVLWLDLVTDMIKLGLYVVFFMMLLTFYGLPIHIMRDLFMTTRDFLKRLSALLRYRRAIQEMNKYPDASEQDLANENTCIICREEMHHWVPTLNSVDRVRPKKLPCGHILHLGCLKSWLERQQVCPTCRSPVTGTQQRVNQGPRAAGFRIQIGGLQQQQQQPQERRGPGANDNNNLRNNGNNHNHNGNNNHNNHNQNQNFDARRGDVPQQGAQNPPAGGQAHTFSFGPIRIGFGTNGQQARELAQRFGVAQGDDNQGQQAQAGGSGSGSGAAASGSFTQAQQPPAVSMQNVGVLLHQAEQMVQRELHSLQVTQQELQLVNILTSELQRLRQRSQQQQQQQQPQDAANPLNAHAHAQLFPFNAPIHHPMPYPAIPTLPPPPPFQTQASPIPGFSTFQHPFGIPPRLNSPLMTRHGAVAASTTTIPAGSPDLPDGVVIPPGWSLMPLQRLDAGASAAGPNLSQPLPQAGIPPPAPNMGGEPVSASQPPAPSIQPTHTSAHPHHEQLPAETSPLIPGLGESSTAQLSSLPQPAQARDDASPQVVSPSPVMPNWGGTAQLFSTGPRLNRPEPQPSLTPTPTTSSTALPQDPTTDPPSTEIESSPLLPPTEPGEPSSSNTQHPEDSNKGKAKAVTIEEADDDAAQD